METAGAGPSGFFEELDARDRDAITSASRRRQYAAVSTLMYEGQEGTEVLVLSACPEHGDG